MVLPEIRLLQAAIVLAEELHFSRAADRLNMSQSALSKQILKLEREIGFQVFRHNHQAAELTDAGRVFIAEAKEVIVHAERSILSARAVLDGPLDVLNIGKSSYTDPFLVSALLSIRLPLFPDLKIKLWSNFSHELAQQVMVGTLDLALITGIPPKPKLSVMNITNNPYYIVMTMDDDLAGHREIRLEQMKTRNWIILGQHANVHLYDAIHSVASDRGVHPSDVYHFTSPEEASELVREHGGLAFLSRVAAWRIARDGLTMRPLTEDRLRLITSLAVHVDSKSRLVNEFVKAAGKKFGGIGQRTQGRLPLTG
ncbi:MULTISPECIES: LysR family transcriptional regulator [Acidobacteriaceae]|uniref:LysR family transcriptional regulator n=1 Tax=Acidobacteriaceae TaxID=204434 RepID=UPI00131EBFAE|nr:MULTISPECIES: LysR family transcriptional regulator [Acidobacteriaceae]MDW5266070.1 LysR family transcriptional regulator [Edaphobacter sp.]